LPSEGQLKLRNLEKSLNEQAAKSLGAAIAEKKSAASTGGGGGQSPFTQGV
jgi:hypothetical protein